MNFFDMISDEEKKLNNTESKIIEYLLMNFDHIENIKISKISSDLYIAPNTVIRLCKKLGYSGFSQMKYDIQKTREKKQLVNHDHTLESLEVLNQTANINSVAVIDQVVKLIDEAEQMVFFGLGLSRLPAEELAKKLRYLDKMVFVPDDRDHCILYANNLKKGQVAFFFSCSGSTDIITKLAYIVKTKDIPMISLTGISQNTLTCYSNYKLFAYFNKIEYQKADLSSRLGFYFITDLIFNKYYRLQANKKDEAHNK